MKSLRFASFSTISCPMQILRTSYLSPLEKEGGRKGGGEGEEGEAGRGRREGWIQQMEVYNNYTKHKSTYLGMKVWGSNFSWPDNNSTASRYSCGSRNKDCSWNRNPCHASEQTSTIINERTQLFYGWSTNSLGQRGDQVMFTYN